YDPASPPFRPISLREEFAAAFAIRAAFSLLAPWSRIFSYSSSSPMLAPWSLRAGMHPACAAGSGRRLTRRGRMARMDFADMQTRALAVRERYAERER